MTEGGVKRRVEVLLVDDDEEDFQLTRDLLLSVDGARYHVHWAADSHSAREAARASSFDVCLVDYRLGPDDGMELVRELVAGDFDMPVILLTGFSDRAVDVEATDAGAADYLVKGEVSSDLLERTIRYAVRSHADMRALRDTQESYRQAQRMEAVGRLAGGVAHDFNNLMSAVVGFSDLVLAQLDPLHPVRRYVEDIRRAGERATALTTQLLAFSRKQVLQPRVLDVNGVVRDIQTLLRRLIGADIDLVGSLEPGLRSVEADPGQLEQVIMNLVVNARDAMPTGGTLTIATANTTFTGDESDGAPHLPAGGYVTLTVTDTGHGMDAATVGQIFEPFFTTKEEGKGTGLGLATVFGIVRQSGGDITVDSEVGRGTSFRIYLPCVTAQADSAPAAAVVNAQPPGGTETILLVEDHELVRHLEREVLRRTGYTVLEATNGAAALELAERHQDRIDLLLTDVVMPGMSGYVLAERLVALRPGIKTLYASGHSEEAIAQQVALGPDTAFLAKPVTPLSLATAIRGLLDACQEASDGLTEQSAA
jgi:two-component system, cell cycle sensor histidine kinase and response regulator CckA